MKRVLGLGWGVLSLYQFQCQSISKGVSAFTGCPASVDIHICLSWFHLPTNSHGMCLLDQRFHKCDWKTAPIQISLWSQPFSIIVSYKQSSHIKKCLFFFLFYFYLMSFNRLPPNENSWNTLDMLWLQAAKFQNALRAKVSIKAIIRWERETGRRGGDRFYHCNNNQIDYLLGFLASKLVHKIASFFTCFELIRVGYITLTEYWMVYISLTLLLFTQIN